MVKRCGFGQDLALEGEADVALGIRAFRHAADAQRSPREGAPGLFARVGGGSAGSLRRQR